jgi:tetratricopeptide (TPR) repeat protein
MIERAAIIAVVNLLFYFKTLSYKYCSDDIPAAHRPKHPKPWVYLLGVIEGRAKSNPHVDHAITTIFHTLTCVFIYLGFGANDVSFLAALLFSFNPSNNQGSVWLSGRSYLLPTLGMTACLSLPFLGPLLLVGVTFFNAGFVFPLILLASPYPWLAAFVPICWIIHYKRFKENVFRKAKMEMYDEDKKIHPKKLILFTKTFGWYLWHALIPTKTTFYHSFLQSLAGSLSYRGYTLCRWFWFGLSAIIGIGWYLLTQEWSIAHFGLIWFCLGIAPFLNLFRIHQEIAERYLYLPNAGLMLVLASILVGHPVLSAMFVTMYATKMWFYMDAYQDDYYLVEYSCMNSPDAWFSWHVRALKRWDTGSKHEAIVLWTMAKMISPKEFKLLYNLGSSLALAGNKKEAQQLYQMASENVPKGQEKMAKELFDIAKQGKIQILI